MEVKGTATISPVLFWSGKAAGYVTYLCMALSAAGVDLPGSHSIYINRVAGILLMAAGLLYMLAGVANLGSSVRIGLPVKDTVLKTSGLYSISRNPVYLGLHLMTIASIIYTLNFWVLLPGLYSIVIYHFIIVGEEKFLSDRFGKQYDDYKLKVRRYL